MSEMKEIRLPQGPIRYRETGAGEPVVLVHGLLANGELWREVAPLLAKDFRVIAPDWPLGSQQLPLDSTPTRPPTSPLPRWPGSWRTSSRRSSSRA